MRKALALVGFLTLGLVGAIYASSGGSISGEGPKTICEDILKRLAASDVDGAISCVRKAHGCPRLEREQRVCHCLLTAENSSPYWSMGVLGGKQAVLCCAVAAAARQESRA